MKKALLYPIWLVYALWNELCSTHGILRTRPDYPGASLDQCRECFKAQVKRRAAIRAWFKRMGFPVLVLLLSASNGQLLAQGGIPARAYQYRRIVHAEIRRQWGLNLPGDAIPVGAGTIHQESGWNPRAQSAYAKGLTQFTDPTWADMRRLDPSIDALGDIWSPAAAIRAMALYHRRLWELFPDASTPDNRWAFVLSAYNGGAGNVRKDMKLAPDPTVWWNSVELKSSRAPSAFKENRVYVSNILRRWVPLYRTF